jgi:adenylate cyclase
VAAGLLAAYALASQLAFAGGLVLPFAAPVAGLGLGAAAAILWSYTRERRARRAGHTLFARFVGEAVASQLLAESDGQVRLGGRRMDSTVMFCDLRGFTRFAETVSAERVIEVLNAYLSEMSDAILDHGGTLVSYLGDGIMAVFGSPIERDDHADAALAAARELAGTRLERFNATLAAAGLDARFELGVGLNSGPVMSGNVGSERRVEYAAVGDTTNVAARLQGMTKEMSHSVLVADSTRARLTRTDDLVDAGEVTLRGRAQRLRVWTIADRDGAQQAPGTLAA